MSFFVLFLSFSSFSILSPAKTNPSFLLTGQHLGPVVVLGLEVEVVLAVLEELRGRDVHADLDLAREAGRLDRLVDEVEALLVRADVGREAALVADVAGVLTCVFFFGGGGRGSSFGRGKGGKVETSKGV